MEDAKEGADNDEHPDATSEAATPPDMGSGNPRWGMDWARVALDAVRTDNPDKIKACFRACHNDEILTSVSVGLVGYGLRFHHVYSVPRPLRMGMVAGETLLDMAHRTKKSPELRATLRSLGCRAVVAVEAERAEVEELKRKARKEELEAEGRV